jgi:hypothetical protein
MNGFSLNFVWKLSHWSLAHSSTLQFSATVNTNVMLSALMKVIISGVVHMQAFETTGQIFIDFVMGVIAFEADANSYF